MFKEKFGFSPQEIENLYERWRKILRYGSGWKTFDDFLQWASETGAEPGNQLRKRDSSLPHGPDNSYWYARPPYQPAKKNDAVSPFCQGCTRECPKGGLGCKAWQDYFVDNWNRNIFRNRKQAEPKPAEPKPETREYFRYEHPDLVREGITFEHVT